jgi:putative glutamine amidotransferase
MRRNTPNYNSAFSVKWVTIKDASSLASYVGSRLLKVNSLHHQAVDKLGKGLSKVAEDTDGFVQGIETDQQFVVGVQWHPEYLFYLKPHRRLFSALKAAAQCGDEKSIEI